MRLLADGNFSVNINNKNKNLRTDLLLGGLHLTEVLVPGVETDLVLQTGAASPSPRTASW